MLKFLSRKQRSQNPEVENLLRAVVETEVRNNRRSDERIDIAIAVAVVPLDEAGQPIIERRFVTVTKNISADGLSIVSSKRIEDNRMLIGFSGAAISFVRAEVLHRERLPLGCEKLGLRMTNLVQPGEFPGLERLSI